MASHEKSFTGAPAQDSDIRPVEEDPRAAAADARPKGLVQRVLPWAVTIGFVTWLLWPYRTEEGRAALLGAFTSASYWAVPVAFLGACAVWLSDSYATARTLQRWKTPISLRETSLIRGATLLFDAINPALGQAVLTIVMYRRGMALSQSLLLVMLMNVVFIVHIAVISGIGLIAGAAPNASLMTWLVIGALGSTALYLAVVVARPAGLASNDTLRWLMDAGLSGHAWAFLYRLPNMIIIIGAQVVFMRCFNINLPLHVSLLYLPAVMFIVGMPLSVQGLGPGQLASVQFFSAYAAGDPANAGTTVLACGFANTALMTLSAVAIGLACLGTETGRQSIAAVRSSAKRTPSGPTPSAPR